MESGRLAFEVRDYLAALLLGFRAIYLLVFDPILRERRGDDGIHRFEAREDDDVAGGEVAD